MMTRPRLEQTLICTGDVILDEPDPASLLAAASPLLSAASVVVAHVEVPHTDRGVQCVAGVPANGAPLANLEALAHAGVSVATLAGNHIFDQGPAGVLDTIAELDRLGIVTAGAGPTLADARRPALVESDGVRVAVLSYNCVGPRESWASAGKAGCAFIDVKTHYEPAQGMPGGPPEIYTFSTPASLAAMTEDVQAAAEQADVVVVAFHKGLGHVPVVVQDYEREVAMHAVDAGADLVVGHHAHIGRGVEFYRGKAIFHGLGNFATVTRVLTPEEGGNDEQQAWAQRRRELFGFAPDPAMPAYPFHPESRNAFVVRCSLNRHGIRSFGFVPCWIDESARPVPVSRGNGGGEIAAYVERISREAGFGTRFEWCGDELVAVTAD
jgi:hypothetical protein